MIREQIKLTEEELGDFDFTGGDTWKLRGETYKHVDTIRTDEYSDGPSWDTVVQRESDEKYFKWGCWDTGSDYEMQYGENYMEEVFPTQITKTIFT